MIEENQLNLIPPLGLFASLAPELKNGTVMIMVSAEKELLRVNLTQKVDDGKHPLSMAVLASPAELDAELAAGIRKALGVAPVLKSVTEQVAEQLTAAPPAAAKAAKPKKKTAAKAKPPKPAKKAAKPKPARPAPKVKAASKKNVTTRPKFTREQMLDEFVRLRNTLNVPLTMDLYVKTATIDGKPVGRSFERPFGGWKNFAAAGDKHQPAIREHKPKNQQAGNTDSPTLPVYFGTAIVHYMPRDEAAALEVGAEFDINAYGRVKLDAKDWDGLHVTTAAQPATVITDREVVDVDGTVLGTTKLCPTVNEMIELTDTDPMKVLAVGKTRITVQRVTEQAPA